MIHRFYTLVLGALLSLFSFNLSAQGLSVYLDTVEVQAGNDVCMAVKVNGFVDVISFQFSLEWRHQVLKFKEVRQFGLPGWSASDFGLHFSSDYLILGWAEPSGSCFDLPDGSTLFEACFTAIGSVGDTTLVPPSEIGLAPGNGSAEAIDCNNQNIWHAMNNKPGLVTIIAFSDVSDPEEEIANTLVLYPNPAHASTRVRFSSKYQDTAVIRVSNTLGNIVFEEKFSVNFDENSFEIPAKALNTKGIYQVSVQTDKGISSQMLSVQ